jgi:exodeoxyribonuclease-3
MRERNIGWRLDYVFASTALASTVTACPVQKEVGTSDHAPVMATFGSDAPQSREAHDEPFSLR